MSRSQDRPDQSSSGITVERKRRRLYQAPAEDVHEPAIEPATDAPASEQTDQETKVSKQEAVRARADRTVRSFMGWSAGLGLIPIPLFDIVALFGIQTAMLTELASLYNVPFTKARIRSLLAATVGGLVTEGIASSKLSYIARHLPGVGSTIGLLTFPALGAACTYAVGRVFIAHFEAGGNLDDFDPASKRDQLAEQLEQRRQLTVDS